MGEAGEGCGLCSCKRTVSDGGGSGLSLRWVVGGGGRGLPGERVHGAKELVCDAPGLAEAAEEGTVYRGWVVPNCVLAGEEESGNRLE